MSVATTKLSSRGQVVIPEEVRRSLGLKEGASFVVVGRGDTVILKTIEPPSPEEFEALLEEARQAARKRGLSRRDVVAAIRKTRRRP